MIKYYNLNITVSIATTLLPIKEKLDYEDEKFLKIDIEDQLEQNRYITKAIINKIEETL